WYPGTPMYDAAKANTYTFDLDKARALLKQANAAANLAFDMLLVKTAEGSAFVEMYQADLASVGLKMNIVYLDLAAWLDQVNNLKYRAMYYSGAGILPSVGSELTGSKVWQ